MYQMNAMLSHQLPDALNYTPQSWEKNVVYEPNDGNKHNLIIRNHFRERFFHNRGSNQQ